MYLSVRDDVVRHAGWATLMDGLRDLNIPTVELGVNRDCEVSVLEPVDGRTGFCLSHESDLILLRSHFRERGVGISAFLVANDFNAADKEAEARWVAQVVRAAGVLGIPAVRVDAIMTGEHDLPPERRKQVIAEGVHRILEATEGLPVDIGIENHGVQGNDPEFVMSLLDAVGSSRFGLTLDSGNFYWAGHPLDEVYAILEKLAPHAKHTHLKNIAYPPEMRNRRREIGWEYGRYVSPLPDGDIDHARVVAFLKAAGYDRDLTLEDESLGKYPVPQRKDVLKCDADHIRALV
ncbi:MAG: sugar phosphate isomerase/epimerase family protein [Armatimonadota bacterium]